MIATDYVLLRTHILNQALYFNILLTIFCLSYGKVLTQLRWVVPGNYSYHPILKQRFNSGKEGGELTRLPVNYLAI